LDSESIWALRIREKSVPLAEFEARFEGRVDRLSFDVFTTHKQKENKYCIRDGGITPECLRKFGFY